MDGPHWHVWCAPALGPSRAFTTRSGDVFNSREAANKWARGQRAAASRRIIRQCDGGDACPGAQLPPERTPLPPPRPRRRRPARLARLRSRLDGLDAEALAAVEALLDDLAAPPQP